MNLDKIQKRAFELMGSRKAHLEREVGGIYYHGQRTANVAVTLRKQLIPDDDSMDNILRASAYFHDVAKGIEPHAKYGTIVAEEALKDLVTEDELASICELISKHKGRDLNNESTSPFVKLFQDADLIEHFGMYEIWMNFQYYAHTNGTMVDAIKFYDEHHDIHVGNNRKLLNYDISKKIFDEKVEFEKLFIDRLKKEGKGGICFDFKKE